jgi:hypothetical protein
MSNRAGKKERKNAIKSETNYTFLIWRGSWRIQDLVSETFFSHQKEVRAR